MITVTLYSRADCPLCDVARQDLAALQADHPHRLIVIDIDTDEALLQAYGEQVPVVEVGPYKKSAPFSRDDLRVTLMAAQDRVNQLQKLDQKPPQPPANVRARLTMADRISYWFTKRYLTVFNSLVFLYVGIPFLAPILMNAGITGPARLIYSAYGAVCHQFAFRSWFLFGDQPVYPRASAGIQEYVPYGQATGLDEDDIFAARDFIGNDQIGYKVAFCERDVAIYGGIFLFGLIFWASGRRLPALPWYLWILVGISPIALDGFSQLLSQPPFEFWPYRESTPLLRTLTGGIFGFSTAWFGYPQIETAMLDTRRMLAVKFARLGERSVEKT